MLIISHRGNLRGNNKLLENNPQHIINVLKKYDVEIDVWFKQQKWYLGHDNPTYQVEYNFFNEKMWIHCKNIEAVENFSGSNLNWFWHENDKITLTSKKKIWCFPGTYIKSGITVELGYNPNLPEYISGICTDYPERYQ